MAATAGIDFKTTFADNQCYKWRYGDRLNYRSYNVIVHSLPKLCLINLFHIIVTITLYALFTVADVIDSQLSNIFIVTSVLKQIKRRNDLKRIICKKYVIHQQFLEEH